VREQNHFRWIPCCTDTGYFTLREICRIFPVRRTEKYYAAISSAPAFTAAFLHRVETVSRITPFLDDAAWSPSPEYSVVRFLQVSFRQDDGSYARFMLEPPCSIRQSVYEHPGPGLLVCRPAGVASMVKQHGACRAHMGVHIRP